MRRFRNTVKRLSFAGFEAFERIGLHVLPVHYYTPVASRRWLRANPSLWRHRLPLHGIRWDLDRQCGWLRALSDTGFTVENYDQLATAGFGPGIGAVEAIILHRFVGSHQPPRIVEVGSGLTTAVVASIARGDITAVEPYPRPGLLELGVKVLERQAQDAPREVFTELREGDLLMIDSTHAVRTGSELTRLYLDILPSLPAGVTVHIHDIYLPYPYSPRVLQNYFDWQETLLVAALLTGNPQLDILCCEAALHHDRPDELLEIIPDYRLEPAIDGLVSAPWATGVGNANLSYPSGLWLRSC